MNRHERRRNAQRISPADEAFARGDYANAQRFQQQDNERALFRLENKQALARDLARQPGEPHNPEALAYVELCRRQAVDNVKCFLARNVINFPKQEPP